jgi:formyltetrahydrofolate synthetase
VNKFPQDTDAEIKLVEKIAVEAGAEGAYVSEVFAKGGEGGAELARAVVDACEKPKDFKFLYPLEIGIKDKIEIIAREMYGAEGVDYLPAADAKITRYTKLGYASMPVCMAKTHLSISHDPKLLGAPSGFRLPIRDVKASCGAGFIYPLCGDIFTMPGLPSEPAFMRIDIDEEGRVVGLE